MPTRNGIAAPLLIAATVALWAVIAWTVLGFANTAAPVPRYNTPCTEDEALVAVHYATPGGFEVNGVTRKCVNFETYVELLETPDCAVVQIINLDLRPQLTYGC